MKALEILGRMVVDLIVFAILIPILIASLLVEIMARVWRVCIELFIGTLKRAKQYILWGKED